MTTKSNNFFIFDCNDNIVGNPNGYRTIRGAIQQKERRGSPAYRAIWAAYENRANKDDHFVCRIEQRS